MKKTPFLLLMTLIPFLGFAQVTEPEKIIGLAKTYKDFMFRNEPAKQIIKETKSDTPEELKYAAEFIIQAITTKNKLLTDKYLTRPDNKILKQIYIIRSVDLNLRKESQVDNLKLIDSLSNKQIPVYELIDNYYSMLFTAVGNKNQPFDFSDDDLKIKNYQLLDDTEKGILFLRCMEYCGKTIWGYMNVVKPPNTEKAFENILKFPKFNGGAYYQYTDFYFNDFEMEVITGKGPQSYKGYYLDKYYELLLTHLLCLKKQGRTEKEQNDLLLGSILKERNLYKYTKYREVLESLFKEQKTE